MGELVMKKGNHVNQISMADTFDWKLGHGGKRKGAGRNKANIPTSPIRVPVALIPKVKIMIEEYKKAVAEDRL